jgi:hypothetical protein
MKASEHGLCMVLKLVIERIIEASKGKLVGGVIAFAKSVVIA